MAITVRDFVYDCYRLISANSPTMPLHGDDQEFAIRILNRLLSSYASTGLMLTIVKSTTFTLTTGTQTISCGPSTVTPTPDITLGRLANFEEAWLVRDGVTYPLIDKDRNVFNASYKYNPLLGLPRFVIVYPETEITTLRFYPAPSQEYELNLRGKFELSDVTSNDDLSVLPNYYQRYLQFACAKDIAMYKGRQQAWTPVLEEMYQAAKLEMEASSEVNLAITGDNASMLNGANLLKAGVF